MSTQTTEQARNLQPRQSFIRFGRTYTVIANERGSGGNGRSILATAQTGERVVLPFRRSTEAVEIA